MVRGEYMELGHKLGLEIGDKDEVVFPDMHVAQLQ